MVSDVPRLRSSTIAGRGQLGGLQGCCLLLPPPNKQGPLHQGITHTKLVLLLRPKSATNSHNSGANQSANHQLWPRPAEGWRLETRQQAARLQSRKQGSESDRRGGSPGARLGCGCMPTNTQGEAGWLGKSGS